MCFSAIRKAKNRTVCLLVSGAILSGFNVRAEYLKCCYPWTNRVLIIKGPDDAVVCPGKKASFISFRRAYYGGWRLNKDYCYIWWDSQVSKNPECQCQSEEAKAAGCSRSYTTALEARDECNFFNGTCAAKSTLTFPEYSTHLNGTIIDIGVNIFGGRQIATSNAARLIYKKIEIPVSSLEATVHLHGADLYWQPGWPEPEVSGDDVSPEVSREEPSDPRYLIHITDLTEPGRVVPCNDCEYIRDSHYTFVPDFDQACHNFSFTVTQDACHSDSTSLYAPAENPPTVSMSAKVSEPPDPVPFQLLSEQQNVLISWEPEAFTRYNLTITDITNSSEPSPVACKGCLSMGVSPYKFTPGKGIFKFRFAMTPYNCMGVGDTAEVEIMTMVPELACPPATSTSP